MSKDSKKSQNSLNAASLTQENTRETDLLIQALPSYLANVTSDHLFLSFLGNDGEKVEELHMRDNTNLEVVFGFFIQVTDASERSKFITLQLNAYEGWLSEGVYTEIYDADTENHINSVNFSIDENIYPCSVKKETTVIVDAIEYVGGKLSFVDMRFAYACLDDKISGRVLWSNDDIEPQAGPSAIPDDFWTPPEDIQALQKTHLYLVDEDARDFYYDQKNSSFGWQELRASAGSIEAQFTINGGIYWNGNITTMSGINKLEKGLYNVSPDFIEQQFAQDLVPARMNWMYEGILVPGQTASNTGNLPQCSLYEGYYVIDRAEYSDNGILQLVDMRFTYECTDGQSAHGRFLWDRNDDTQPPKPKEIPDALWNTAEERSLSDGNYLFLQGDENEFLSQGLSYEFDYDNAKFVVTQETDNRAVYFDIETNEALQLSLFHMSSIEKFEQGFYEKKDFYANNVAVTGYHSFNMSGRGSSSSSGWYAIDHIIYDGDSISEIIVRFEYISDFSGKGVRGKIFWSRDSELVPSNPKSTPTDLWAPSDNLANSCATNNTLKLQITNDSIFNINFDLKAYNNVSAFVVFEKINGLHTQYAATNAWEVSFTSQSPNNVTSPVNDFTMHINGTYLQDKLEMGFYADIFGKNPAKGELDIGISGLSCSIAEGWMNIDDVVYNDNIEIVKLDLRFAITCLGDSRGSPTLYGQLNWTK